MINVRTTEIVARAKALAKSDNHGSADSLLTELLQNTRDDPTVWVARAFVRELARDLGGAERDMTEAIALQDGEPDYFFTRGRYRLALNQIDGAIADFSLTLELSMRLNSDYYREPAQLARAEAHLRLGLLDKARADCALVSNADMTWPGVRSKTEILARCDTARN